MGSEAPYCDHMADLRELEPIRVERDSPRAPPAWLGMTGVVAAVGVLLIGLGLFASLAPDNAAPVDTIPPASTTTSVAPAVRFPDLVVADPSGVRLEGQDPRFLSAGCAVRAIDDLDGGLVIDRCAGGIVHVASDGEEKVVASDQFALHFVEQLGVGGPVMALALNVSPLIDSVDAVGYDVSERIVSELSVPRFSWWASGERASVVVGFDLGEWVVAEGCMQIQTRDDPPQSLAIGCADGEEPVVAAAVPDRGEQVAFVSRNPAGAHVLRILSIESGDTTASVRMEGEPVGLDFDGRFAAVAVAVDGGVQTTVIDMDSYSKREYEGLGTFMRSAPAFGG